MTDSPEAGPTLGPWEWVVHDHSMASLQGPREEWQHVLSISPCGACQERNDKEWAWGRCTVPTEANARLLAASWELREALKVLLESYVSMVSSGDCGHWNPEVDAEVIAARSALAKAEGR